MNINNTAIRIATPDDAYKILNIYIPYIKNTAITFEYEVPDLSEFRSRIENTLKKYPYLVCVDSNEIIGYAYTGPFKNRAAYNWAVEETIYVRSDVKHMGIGKKLYSALESISKEQHILNLNACIAYKDTEDTYLTKNSMQFHKHMGYSIVGKFHKCGYKFNKWYDMIWMEKIIGKHLQNQQDIIPFSEFRDDFINKIII